MQPQPHLLAPAGKACSRAHSKSSTTSESSTPCSPLAHPTHGSAFTLGHSHGEVAPSARQNRPPKTSLTPTYGWSLNRELKRFSATASTRSAVESSSAWHSLVSRRTTPASRSRYPTAKPSTQTTSSAATEPK